VKAHKSANKDTATLDEPPVYAVQRARVARGGLNTPAEQLAVTFDVFRKTGTYPFSQKTSQVWVELIVKVQVEFNFFGSATAHAPVGKLRRTAVSLE